MKKLISILALTSFLAGCQEGGNSLITRQNATTALGAIGGGILGSNVGKGKGRMLGAAVGALGGAAFGNWLGANLDPKDQKIHYETTQESLETTPIGYSREWNDPQTGVRGEVMPTRTYKMNNRNCREYTQTIFINGKSHDGHGTACRTPNGTWEIANN
jgi:surface antigen